VAVLFPGICPGISPGHSRQSPWT